MDYNQSSSNIPLPSQDQAFQFATMLRAGLPAEQAILYFLSDSDPVIITATLSKWQRSRAVGQAVKALEGKEWTEMSLDEMLNASLAQHYRTLAFLLYSTNYITANQGEKSKLDSARQAIEAKIAGTAGKVDALSAFYDDLRTGKIKLAARVN
jgi:hypothetical protein